MKPTASRSSEFFRKALDVMYRAVGFPGFDKKFAQQEGWYSKREWTTQQREDFRKWFVSSSKRDLRWSKHVAEREFALFDLMWGWREKKDSTGT
jgi:hypothetical protein